MKDDSLGCNYLHPNFWYHGMNKGKLGKGYRNDIPIGVIGGKCKECEGTVISIKMNTSRKGMECTSEKVCDTCGLVVPGAFQVLEPKPPYKSKYYATHEDWIEDNCKETQGLTNTDIDIMNELYEHNTGHRPNTDDSVIYEENESLYPNLYHNNPRLKLAINRLAATPASQKQPMQEWRLKQYHEIADEYIHMLDLLNYQSIDVHYYIDNNQMYMGRYKVEDIIYNLCLVIGNKDLRKYQDHNKKLCSLLTDRLGR